MNCLGLSYDAQLVKERCPTCRLPSDYYLFTCPQCGAQEKRYVEEGPLPPNGWLGVVELTAPGAGQLVPLYCSWACIKAHAEGVLLARG